MQLKKNRYVAGALALATGTLLQTPVAAESLEFDSALLYYGEDNRVTAIEPVIKGRYEYANDRFVTTRLVVDSLTGSSPNGAMAVDQPQTFTSPSGQATYDAAAGKTPLDPTFLDTRVALKVDWDRPLGRFSRHVYSVNLSSEYDYQSLSVAGVFTRDANQRNTTYTLGMSGNFDRLNPVGGIPQGLTPMPTTALGSRLEAGDSDQKLIGELLVGVTQVVSPKSLLQVNYTFGRDSGYLSEPYKILSVLDAAGDLRIADPYLYERRPDSRQRHALFIRGMHQLDKDVVNISYRYFFDDWGIRSHTLEGRYRWEFKPRAFLEPHLRYYLQQQADFYHYNLVESDIPQYASADYRLADMSTTTYGLKFGYLFNPKHEFGFRLEQMTQSSEGDDPFPDVNAFILQFSYNVLF